MPGDLYVNSNDVNRKTPANTAIPSTPEIAPASLPVSTMHTTLVRHVFLAIAATAVAASANAQIFDTRTSHCQSHLRDALQKKDVQYNTDPDYRKNPKLVASSRDFTTKRVNAIEQRIASEPATWFNEGMEWLSSEEALGNGGGPGEVELQQYGECLLDEKFRMATNESQTVGGVRIQIRYAPAPSCFNVTVTNETGKNIDAFVRLGISNLASGALREATGWAGDPTRAVMTRPDGVVTLFSTGSHFTNLTSQGVGSSKTLPFVFSISNSEPDYFALTKMGPLPNPCHGLRVWLPDNGALKWNENIVEASNKKAR